MTYKTEKIRCGTGVLGHKNTAASALGSSRMKFACSLYGLEQFRWIYAFVDELLDFVHSALAILGIGYAEPFACCVEHFNGCGVFLF